MSVIKLSRSPFVAVVLACVIALQASAQTAGSQPPPAQPAQPTQPAQPMDTASAPFHVTVLDGEGSINNIREEVNRPITVRVEDPDQNPIAGASVSFFLPDDGPGGIFLNGSRVLTTFTDAQGIATSRGIRFNNIVGIMKIKIVASVFSQATSTFVTQTNVSSGAATRMRFQPDTGLSTVESGHHFPLKKVLIWTVVIGGAAAAAYILLNRSSPPSATVTLGTPVITAP